MKYRAKKENFYRNRVYKKGETAEFEKQPPKWWECITTKESSAGEQVTSDDEKESPKK